MFLIALCHCENNIGGHGLPPHNQSCKIHSFSWIKLLVLGLSCCPEPRQSRQLVSFNTLSMLSFCPLKQGPSEAMPVFVNNIISHWVNPVLQQYIFFPWRFFFNTHVCIKICIYPPIYLSSIHLLFLMPYISLFERPFFIPLNKRWSSSALFATRITPVVQKGITYIKICKGLWFNWPETSISVIGR